VDFCGIKQDSKVIYPPAVAEERRKYWSRIKDGTTVKTSITVPRPGKSDLQLGAIWGLMLSQAVNELSDRGYDTSFIYNLPNPTGIEITKDDLCQYFYNACPIYNGVGHRITLSKSSTTEAAKFFEDVRNFLASQWSIVVENPDPDWKNKK